MRDRFDEIPPGGAFDGRPTTRHHPLKDVFGPLSEDGPDRLLERLREAHGEPRFDIPRELQAR